MLFLLLVNHFFCDLNFYTVFNFAFLNFAGISISASLISPFIYYNHKNREVRVTNCKGLHTINTANVGSTRDLISQNEMYKGKRLQG